MKITFDSLEEEFKYYARRALEAKEKGDKVNYLINLKISTDLLKKINSSGKGVEQDDEKKKIIPR